MGAQSPPRSGTQGIKQATKRVVIELVHQRQQFADFAMWEAFACEPAEIVTGEIGDEGSFILPIGHFTGEQKLKVFRFHVATL